MDIVSQQFLMGAGGGKTTYWLASITTSAGTGSNSAVQYQQCIRVDATSNVYISIGYSGNAITVAKMTDLGTISWNTSYQGDGSSNYNYTTTFGQLVLCSDGSCVTSGGLYDFINSRQAGFLTYSSSGAYQSQRNIYGSTFGSGTITFGTAQLPNTNLITFPAGGYGTAVIMNSAATSVSVTRNNYKVSSSSSICNLWNRTGAYYNPVKVYGGVPYLLDSGITIGSDNVIGLLVLNSDGSASGASYAYKQPGYSVDYYISSKNHAVTSSGVYLVYNSGQFDGTYYFLFSYSSFSTGVAFTKMLTGVTLNSNAPMLEVDPQGNAYLVWMIDSNTVNVFKYDSTGTIVWKRKLYCSNSTLATFGGAVVTSQALYFYINTTVAKLPLDGSLTGTYGPFTWSASTDTDSSSYTLTQTAYGSSSSSTTTNPSVSTPGTIPLTRTVTPTQYLMS